MRSRASSPLPWLGGLLVLYLLVPIVAFVVRLGGGIAASPGLGAALGTSLLTATIAAAVVAVLGTPLAYLLARRRGFFARALLALVALPLALPALMSGVLLLYVVGPFTIPGKLFDGRLVDTRAAIVLAQIFVSAPFLIIAARAAFAAVDPALEDVAATLGHGRVARFTRVAIPAALPGIGAGIMLTWLRAFSEFGATVILAYHPFSLPVFTFVQFDETGLPATIGPVAAALGIALIVLVAVQLPLPRRRGGAARGVTATPPSSSAEALAPEALDFDLAKQLGTFFLKLTHTATSPRLALLGPSGSGKTLTLRLLAGLTAPQPGGHVRSGARALDELAVQRRGIGYVPQQAALMPRQTVWRQVTFGVGAQPGLAVWWLARLGLQGLEDRYPEELSGGQQRRVALARALAVAPRLLLLDEPFTGLDTPVRDRLRRDLRRLQREVGLSTVIVTHDPEEAALLADEIVVLGDGHVLQSGTREAIFHAPASPRIAALLGISNTHRGVTVARDRVLTDGVEIEARTGVLPPGTEVVWCVRPERISLCADGRYAAILVDDVDLGSVRELTLALEGALELTLRSERTESLQIGQALRVALKVEDIALWPSAGSGTEPASDLALPTASRDA